MFHVSIKTLSSLNFYGEPRETHPRSPARARARARDEYEERKKKKKKRRKD